jgi:hypothetical protein
VQANLVSDILGLAQFTDPALKNPWGVSESPTGPFWISDQGTNESTLYSLSSASVVSKPALTVAIPTTVGGPQGPTGQVNNTGGGFVVGGRPADFIFANLNGTISARIPALARRRRSRRPPPAQSTPASQLTRHPAGSTP